MIEKPQTDNRKPNLSSGVSPLPLMVTIVGRENVGKSTLFNRLVGRRTAITYREPGITRDRNIKEVNLDGTNVIKIVDTGGYYPDEPQCLKAKVREQIEISLKSADLILFMVDAKDGLMALDNEFATSVRKSNKKVILVVNKIDIESRKSLALEFYKLGFNEVLPISAIHSVGIDVLIDKIKDNCKSLTTITDSSRYGMDWDNRIIKVPMFAILGRPNVGKSTYINAVLNEQRMIVDENPGTTIDSIDITMNYKGQELMLIDTPGLRRRTKIETDVEYYSAVRTKTSISKCDVAILIVDGTIPITHQDKRIIADIIEEGKGIVIAVNKIDIGVEFSESALRFASFIPVIYISALQGNRIYEPIKEALRVWKARRQRIPKKEFLSKLQELKVRTRIIKITQIGIEPPTFHIRSNRKLKPQSIRFIEKTIRSTFNFIGSPIKIEVSRMLANQKLKSRDTKKMTKMKTGQNLTKDMGSSRVLRVGKAFPSNAGSRRKREMPYHRKRMGIKAHSTRLTDSNRKAVGSKRISVR